MPCVDMSLLIWYSIWKKCGLKTKARNGNSWWDIWRNSMIWVPTSQQGQSETKTMHTNYLLQYDIVGRIMQLIPFHKYHNPMKNTKLCIQCIFHYNMVRWISAPGTMHFRPRYDTFWPCGLFTLFQFCKHPPPPPQKKKKKKNQHETEMSN